MAPSNEKRHEHRASQSLKQQNKKHKATANKKVAGRVGASSVKSSHSSRGALSKAARLNRAKQLQRQARDALLKRRREASTEAPLLICVVPLSERVDVGAFVRRLVGRGEEGMDEEDRVVLGRDGKCIYLGAEHGDIRGTLEYAASADAILAVMASPPIDTSLIASKDDDDMESCYSFISSTSTKGRTLLDARSVEAGRVLDALKVQGCPACLMGAIWCDPEGMLAGPDIAISSKRRRKLEAEADSLARRFFGSEFGQKLPWKRLDASQKSAQELARLAQAQLSKVSGREPSWRHRSVLLTDSCFRHNDTYLRITGWIRHASLSSARLLHVPGAGATRIIEVDGTPSASMLEGDEPLEMAAQRDTLAGEQTWPQEEELADSVPMVAKKKKKKKKLESDYQAAWNCDDDDDDINDDDDLQEEEEEDDDNDMEEEDDMMAVEEMRKEYKEELQFPDEVDTPESMTARERFARYRYLDSVRTSDWDPYETLPRPYAAVYQLPDYQLARKRALAESAECGDYEVGSRHEFLVECLDTDAARRAEDLFRLKKIFTCPSLHRHENRLSIVHCVIRASANDLTLADHAPDTKIVKSKQLLRVQVGHRSWLARPIFSTTALAGKKHKYHKFMQPNDTCVLSFYGPTTFGPAPVFLYDPNQHNVLATGNLLDADPSRILLKRIVLTGIPARSHKRKAVVKLMFNNPEDVRYFKPAQLSTKHGLTANIIEPLGTHGHFKVALSKPMGQHDTFLLPLYKRVFPKLPSASEEADGSETAFAKELAASLV